MSGTHEVILSEGGVAREREWSVAIEASEDVPVYAGAGLRAAARCVERHVAYSGDLL